MSMTTTKIDEWSIAKRWNPYNSDKLLGVLSADRVCTDNPNVTGAKLQAIMGKPDAAVMTAEINFLNEFLDEFFVKSAHAATGDHFYLTFSVGAEIELMVEGSIGVTIATDFLGDWGLYFDKTVGIITNLGGEGNIALGFYPKANLNTFSGKGWSISASIGPPTGRLQGYT